MTVWEKLKMDKISVIVPVYKVEKYLEKSVDSILSQTYENIEVILVDDGSPDGCPAICDEYARADSRVKVIHKKNGGLSDARNAGIEAAASSYIMFVDSDDFISANMAEKLYLAITSGNTDIAVCSLVCVDEDGNEIGIGGSPVPDGVLTADEVIGRYLDDPYNWWHWITACNKLYKRGIFDSLRFPVGKLHEDEFVFHEVILRCEKIACIPDKLYNYFQRSGSICHKESMCSKLDDVEAFFLRARRLSEAGYDEAAYKSLDKGVNFIYGLYSDNGRGIDEETGKKMRYIQELYKSTAPGVISRAGRIAASARIKHLVARLGWYRLTVPAVALRRALKKNM